MIRRIRLYSICAGAIALSGLGFELSGCLNNPSSGGGGSTGSNGHTRPAGVARPEGDNGQDTGIARHGETVAATIRYDALAAEERLLVDSLSDLQRQQTETSRSLKEYKDRVAGILEALVGKIEAQQKTIDELKTAREVPAKTTERSTCSAGPAHNARNAAATDAN